MERNVRTEKEEIGEAIADAMLSAVSVVMVLIAELDAQEKISRASLIARYRKVGRRMDEGIARRLCFAMADELAGAPKQRPKRRAK
jgi:hypothetical protein